LKKFTYFFLLVSFITFFGCSVNPLSPIGPGISLVLTWIDGEAHKYYLTDSDILYRSTKRSCNKLGYKIEKDNDLGDGNYHIIAGNNDRFKINIKHIDNNISKLSVRVNFWGDRPYAELIYSEIDKELSAIEYDSNGKPKVKH